MVHEWLGDLLAVIRAPRLVRRAVRKVINLWRIDLEIVTETGTARIRVRYLRGLFQGDVLSPLLFVLPVAPLSLLLGIAGGYNTAHNARPVTPPLYGRPQGLRAIEGRVGVHIGGGGEAG